MMVSTAIVVLPMARSPMMSSRWPRPSANSVSTHDKAGLDRLGHEIAIDDRRRRTLDRRPHIGRDRPLPSSGRAQRIDDAAEQRRSHRHAHHVTGAPHGIAGLDCIDIIQQDTADPVVFEHLGETELPLVEMQELVEADVRQTRNERDAVADFLNAATCSVRAPSAAAPTLARACSSQTSARPSGLLVIGYIRQNSVEIGAPAIGYDEIRTVQFQTGDETRIGVVKAICGLAPKAVAIRWRQCSCSPASSGIALTASSTTPPAIPACRVASGNLPICWTSQSRNTLRTDGPSRTADQSLRNIDREMARTHGPGLLGGFPLSFATPVFAAASSAATSFAVSPRRTVRACSALSLGRLEDRLTFPGEAGARPLNIGQHGGGLGLPSLRLGQRLLARRHDAARSWPPPDARRNDRAARSGSGTLMV